MGVDVGVDASSIGPGPAVIAGDATIGADNTAARAAEMLRVRNMRYSFGSWITRQERP
jgi:hypothetical protein